MIDNYYDREEEWSVVETDLLRTFVTVLRVGSFTAAARELGYVQSTVTGHLQALERRLGARLLDRLPTGAVATDAGGRLLPYAEQLLELQRRMAAEVAAEPETPAGPVRLVAPESLCAYRLPTVLTALRASAPQVQLSLAPAGTAQALAWLREGSASAALVLEPALAAADLVLERLGPEPLSLLTAPGSAAGALRWRDLVARDALLLEEGCSYSDHVAQRLVAAGQPDSRRIRFGSIEAIKRCVAADVGWAVLPSVTAADELLEGALLARRGPRLPAPRVHLAVQRDRTTGAATRLVLDSVRGLWRAAGSASEGS